MRAAPPVPVPSPALGPAGQGARSRAGLCRPGVPWAAGTGAAFALTPLGLSLFTGSQKPFPGLPPETSPAAPSLELDQRLARHCHHGPRSPSQSRAELQACRKLGIACAICFVFMIGEVVAGGYLAHSLAIMTDAAHLLADVGSMVVSLFSLWVSARPPTKSMSFGWHRSETLGALASVLSIWVVTGVLVYLASARIVSNDYEIDARAMLATSTCAVGINVINDYEIDARAMLATSTCAVGINVIMAYILHQSVTGHSHAQGYEKMEERLQSLGWLSAATIIYVEPRYKIADPVSTFLFSVFVLGSTITILRDVFRVLMEDAGADMEDVLQEATAQLQRTFGFVSCTVVERYLEDMATCRQCQDPRD
ncbi:Zinc transporter 3 [Chelonia mydas]|uniref:Probable proton-coupled zinc antiporter SLC30A3 n=1 Tax=Chelonia mydas TaxID=8469 RepID=M7CB60_CHEMY|nr:Zinc transporter 3 [Chelonia mydas]